MLKLEKDRVIFAGGVQFTTLPDANNENSLAVTIINVNNINTVTLKNIIATIVTNLTGGRNGVSVSFLGDSNTTIKNNTAIKTNTGFDKLLVTNKVYRFTPFAGIWYEDA